MKRRRKRPPARSEVVKVAPPAVVVPQPEVNRPVEKKSEAVKPVVTKLEAVKPVVTKSDLVKPGVIKSEVVKPVATKSDLVKPGVIISKVIKPGVTKSEVVKPGMMKSEVIKPVIKLVVQPEVTRPVPPPLHAIRTDQGSSDDEADDATPTNETLAPYILLSEIDDKNLYTIKNICEAETLVPEQASLNVIDIIVDVQKSNNISVIPMFEDYGLDQESISSQINSISSDITCEVEPSRLIPSGTTSSISDPYNISVGQKINDFPARVSPRRKLSLELDCVSPPVHYYTRKRFSLDLNLSSAPSDNEVPDFNINGNILNDEHQDNDSLELNTKSVETEPPQNGINEHESDLIATDNYILVDYSSSSNEESMLSSSDTSLDDRSNESDGETLTKGSIFPVDDYTLTKSKASATDDDTVTELKGSASTVESLPSSTSMVSDTRSSLDDCSSEADDDTLTKGSIFPTDDDTVTELNGSTFPSNLNSQSEEEGNGVGFNSELQGSKSSRKLLSQISTESSEGANDGDESEQETTPTNEDNMFFFKRPYPQIAPRLSVLERTGSCRSSQRSVVNKRSESAPETVLRKQQPHLSRHRTQSLYVAASRAPVIDRQEVGQAKSNSPRLTRRGSEAGQAKSNSPRLTRRGSEAGQARSNSPQILRRASEMAQSFFGRPHSMFIGRSNVIEVDSEDEDDDEVDGFKILFPPKRSLALLPTSELLLKVMFY